MNKFDEMRTAVNEAKVMICAADNVAHDMAALLRGRLTRVGSYVLADLKKELRNFNMHTRRWKK